MPKKKRATIRKEKIRFPNGRELEVDAFDAEIVLNSGREGIDESIDELLKEAEIEDAIQDALREIKTIAESYPGREKNIWYCYTVGKVLQFVDSKGFTDRRGLIWRRMAFDLRPDLFNRTKKDAEESKRYPEFMYHLGKQSKKNIGRATFNQWREIVKFKEINKDQDKEFLEQILTICETEGLSRQRIKKLRGSKYK